MVDLGVHEGTLLKLNLKKGWMRNGFVWLCIRTSDGGLVNAVVNLRFVYNAGNFLTNSNNVAHVR